MVKRFTAKYAVSHFGKVNLPEIGLKVVNDRGYHQGNGDLPGFKGVGHFQVSHSLPGNRIKTRAHRQGDKERKNRQIKNQLKHLKETVMPVEIIPPAFQHHVKNCEKITEIIRNSLELPCGTGREKQPTT